MKTYLIPGFSVQIVATFYSKSEYRIIEFWIVIGIIIPHVLLAHT